MFDHVHSVTRGRSGSLRFYQACLPPLGYVQIASQDGVAVFGGKDTARFVIGTPRPAYWQNQHAAGMAPVHLCLSAPNEDAVNAFHHAAVGEGGIDNGAPGHRVEGSGDYSAFVLDPDGNNIGAVFHDPGY